MARKRASPTAAPMMLGVLVFMGFSLVPSMGLVDGNQLLQPACHSGDLVIPGGCEAGLSGIPDGGAGLSDGGGRGKARGRPGYWQSGEPARVRRFDQATSSGFWYPYPEPRITWDPDRS